MRMKLSKAQFTWLKWLHDNGGSGYLDSHKVIAGGEPSTFGSAISFLRLVVAGAIEGKDGRLVITDYGRRLLTP
jgi:hypothetical protein